jgi:hypothetical protein
MKIKRSIESSYAMQVKYLLAFIRFIHKNPMVSAEEVIVGCKISDSTFYRYLLMASAFDVGIITTRCMGEKCKYSIGSYGVFDKGKL